MLFLWQSQGDNYYVPTLLGHCPSGTAALLCKAYHCNTFLTIKACPIVTDSLFYAEHAALHRSLACPML